MTVRLALLGDSIAYGVGATRVVDRLAPRLVAGLRAAGIAAEAEVFAVPGARSDGLRRQVDSATRWSPDVVVLVVGANDVTHLVDPAHGARLLRSALAPLVAAGARVVVVPAPDMSVVPRVPVSLRAAVRAASQAYRRAQTDAATAAGAQVVDAVDTASSTFAGDRSMFAADRFHPSSAGYAVIADALLPAVLRAAVTDVDRDEQAS